MLGSLGFFQVWWVSQCLRGRAKMASQQQSGSIHILRSLWVQVGFCHVFSGLMGIWMFTRQSQAGKSAAVRAIHRSCLLWVYFGFTLGSSWVLLGSLRFFRFDEYLNVYKTETSWQDWVFLRFSQILSGFLQLSQAFFNSHKFSLIFSNSLTFSQIISGSQRIPKRSQYINVHFMSNLQMSGCGSKQDVLVLVTWRYFH